ncbi:MAG: hypothetical protein KDD70_04890 [Bdellovibrionales bacterium]|nr:hypothetical protein [Bdellovibrionales bacterium]
MPEQTPKASISSYDLPDDFEVDYWEGVRIGVSMLDPEADSVAITNNMRAGILQSEDSDSLLIYHKDPLVLASDLLGKPKGEETNRELVDIRAEYLAQLRIAHLAHLIEPSSS